MSSFEIVVSGIAALLLFWVIGAYNRLVRLRSTIVRLFAPVEQQFRMRHAVLLQLLDTLKPLLTQARPRIDALRAACSQVETACTHASLRPGATGAITSLRLAEEILVQARARLPVQSVAGSPLAKLHEELQIGDATLAFARGQFNTAVAEYNRAVTQFPTVLLVRLFGFRSAATL